MTKRNLYKIAFPGRIAINSNKHYTRSTRPQLIEIINKRYKGVKYD